MAETWFDSHCHLQEQFLSGSEGEDHELFASLNRAKAAGVTSMVVVGTDEVTSRQAIALAQASRTGELGADAPNIWATVGLHPHDASTGTSWLPALLREQRDVISGVGECGLDYFYENSPQSSQREAFLEQVALAKEHNLALVIHARDAWDDLFGALDEVGTPERTVLHCFTGGPEQASACVDRGMFVSFSGIVTFKNASPIRAALHRVPTSHLLLETDSPFLAPVPHRGSQNEPAWVSVVGHFIAAELGLASEEVARLTAENARAAFALSEGL